MRGVRVNVLGVRISPINPQIARETVEGWIRNGERHYVNVCTVHTVMECQADPALRAVVNHSGLSTPDGMPLVWLSRRHGHREADRVYGPDLLLAFCEHGQTRGWRHYFYGGMPGVADRLVANLQSRFPAMIVAGTYSPPFRPAGAPEADEIVERINASAPDIVWVGLGTPKQDFWVANHRPRLRASALIAVGAAFDFHAGLLPQAPRWMQRSGLEWLFRLAHEPRRLAYRYLVFNPLFVFNVLLQAAGLKRFPIEAASADV